MRLFEIFLLLTATILPFLISKKFFKKYKIAIIILILVIVVCQFLIEGFRWQLIPGLVIVLIVAILLYKEVKFLNGGWISNTLKILFWFILLGLAWTLPYIFPVFNLPSPTGEYKVGSSYLKVATDSLEIITKVPEDKREFMVKVWYPATINNENKEQYLDQGNRFGFSNKYGLPKFTMNYLDYIETHTYISPEVAKDKFPVLIFSHGSYSEAFGYYALMEEIVSHGFIVININHTYESSGSLFPNGDIKLYDAAFDQETNDVKMGEMAWIATENYKKATTEKERFIAVEDLIRDYVAGDISKRWSADISTVIDNLDQWDKSSFLSKHLDLPKIGVFGHSQGGTAVGQALIDDKRINAGINLDGVQWGPMIDSTITKPFMLISSDWNKDHLNLNKYAYRNLKKSEYYNITIKNTGHSNFMDIILLINSSYINEAGKIDSYKGYKIISSLILDFFNENLNNQDSRIEHLVDEFEEIEIVN